MYEFDNCIVGFKTRIDVNDYRAWLNENEEIVKGAKIARTSNYTQEELGNRQKLSNEAKGYSRETTSIESVIRYYTLTIIMTAISPIVGLVMICLNKIMSAEEKLKISIIMILIIIIRYIV